MRTSLLLALILAIAHSTGATTAGEVASRVLLYGDSNTWGAFPSVTAPGSRLPVATTWPYVLDTQLPDNIDVVVEGLGGRTTDYDPDPEAPIRLSGAEILPTVLATHRPVDVLVIMLGTNDLLAPYNRSVEEIAGGVDRLIEIARTVRPAGTDDRAPQIVLVAPPKLGDNIYETAFGEYFAGGLEKSRQLAEAFAEVAERLDVEFFDAASVVQLETDDAIHFAPADHQAFAAAMEPLILELLDDKQQEQP